MYKKITKSFSSQPNPFAHVRKSFQVKDQTYDYFSLPDLKDSRVEKLPFSIRVLLESAVRNCDEFKISSKDVEKILDWKTTSLQDVEIPFKPARVVLQDFTGVPAVVDLAAMRDAMARLGKDPQHINPQIPVDLVVDHSVQADVSRVKNAFEKNEEIEFARNYERFEFLKWGQSAFKNFSITPPGSGIVHQVNLEYLARVVMQNEKMLYPDSLVGTDSHTTMINGLGVAGWGVGGIEAEAVMLGEAIAMVLPKVVGFKLTGELKHYVTATDCVLTIVQMLRKRGVVGQFVEFYGAGVQNLNLADRATIANMAPEYGATMGFFPVDQQSIDYLHLTGRGDEKSEMIKQYLTRQGLFRTYDGTQVDPEFSGATMELDLSTVEPCLAGPKRPHDRVALSDMKSDWKQCLTNKVGFKGFGLKPEATEKTAKFTFENKDYTLSHGSVVIAAITSCTNTSNPDVMMQAGLLAKNAVAKGLKVAPFIKTTLSPGSQVVSSYLQNSGLEAELEKLGFFNAGYGCMTCIGNSGELDTPVSKAITDNDIVACAVLSGNRNFEARVHPLSRGNYLASPPLVVAYALAGNVNIDFEKEPIGQDQHGEDVFLKDIWPSREQVKEQCNKYLNAKQFTDVYKKISQGTDRWNALEVPKNKQFQWRENSTYIHNPPFFQTLQPEPVPVKDIKGAYCLLNFGDSITTDHISPAGAIAKNSPAARFLADKHVEQKDFNTYGARRGTFANTRLINKLVDEVGPQTIHFPSGKQLAIYDAAMEYKKAGHQQVILAGQEYGSGSSRDWAAKGPYLQGINLVIAQSFERIHRSNLVGMGILPSCFLEGQNADSLGLTGKERFNVNLRQGDLKVNEVIDVNTDCGKKFQIKVRLDTPVEVEYFKNGGILQYVMRKLVRDN